MGVGKKLKSILDQYGKTTAWLSRETGIPATTLRSMISRDGSLNYEDAETICNALNISINELRDEEFVAFGSTGFAFTGARMSLITELQTLGYDYRQDFIINDNGDYEEVVYLVGHGHRVELSGDDYTTLACDVLDYLDFKVSSIIKKKEKELNNGTENKQDGHGHQ